MTQVLKRHKELDRCPLCDSNDIGSTTLTKVVKNNVKRIYCTPVEYIDDAGGTIPGYTETNLIQVIDYTKKGDKRYYYPDMPVLRMLQKKESEEDNVRKKDLSLREDSHQKEQRV